MKQKVIAFLFGLSLAVSVGVFGATVYNIFSPGGALSGTWNSQSVDLTQTSFLTGPLGVTKGGTGVATLTGLALGTGTTAFSAYAGTACANQFPRSLDLNGAATCATVALTTDVGGILPISNGGNGTSTPTANPTANVGLSVVNGAATTYMRSDAAPALSQSIAPTWIGWHQFAFVATATQATLVAKVGGAQTELWDTGAAANGQRWNWYANNTPTLHGRALNDAGTVGDDWIAITRSGVAITNIDIGNSTDNPAVTLNGAALKAILSGTTGSIGGVALLAGQCSSGTVNITGATTSMVALADPNTYPGDGTVWDGQVTSAGVVTVKVCAIVALSPSASTYNVRVIP